MAEAGLSKAGDGAVVAGGAAVLSVERVLAGVTALRARLMGMPVGKRSWLIASVLFLVAMCAGMVWYAGRPDWRVLISGLDGKDVQQVTQELSGAGIPFETTPDGAGVQVPAEMLDKARMEVAAKGMPQTGRMGFELFDKPNWVGSEFDERVNYQRAMEGELEHTIATLGVVKSARVHLVLPQPSLFSGEEKLAKASVVLKLKRATLEMEQMESIRSLVASAVENLSPEQVTLVDADGRVSFKTRTKSATDGELEHAMEAKLVAMLEPMAGHENVRATVNVSYEQGNEERTDEVYDPTQTATLTMQRSEQSSAQAGKASGIPGTASNSPAAGAAGGAAGSQAASAPGTPPLLQKEALPVFPQAASGGQSVHEESGTYGVTKHIVHTEQGPGRVRRITAAVVVNDRSVMEGQGNTGHQAWKQRGAEEMKRMEQLAQAAVGFDAKRGDQVVIENVGFSTNVPELQPAALDRVLEETTKLLHAQPGLMRTVLIALCGFVLVIFVLRPVAKQVAATLREPLRLGAGVSVAETMAMPAQNRLPEEGDGVSWRKARNPRSTEGVFDRVTEHIRREPAQSKRLLEAWIAGDESK